MDYEGLAIAKFCHTLALLSRHGGLDLKFTLPARTISKFIFSNFWEYSLFHFSKLEKNLFFLSFFATIGLD